MAEDTDDTLNLDEAALAIEGLHEDVEPAIEPDQDEGDEAEAEEPEAQDDEDDEPENPAIVAPASLNAEEKARFTQLPLEAQRMLADVETRRARQVTEATTNAANAQRQAEANAAQSVVEAKQAFAQQLHTFASAYQPRQPNPADYGDNMQAYARDHAQWQHDLGQHQQLMHQVNAIGQEAQGEAERHNAERGQVERQKLQQALPDWFDAEKGPKLRDDLTAIGSELGYSPELMAMADAGDLMALNKALGWKRDSEKLKSIRDRQMQGVRAAKKSAPVGVSQPQGAGRKQVAKDAMAKVAKSGSVDDAAAAIAALGL